MKTVPRVFAYLRRYPWMALGMLACAIVSTLMLVIFPAVTKRVIDEVLTQHHAEKLTPLVLIAALACAAVWTHETCSILFSCANDAGVSFCSSRSCGPQLTLTQGNNMTKNWKSKKNQRNAAAAFLRKTLTDPDVRSTVLKGRKAAHQLFEREGGLNIPDDVEVICVGPSTQERDRLVVFVLPPGDTAIEQIDPLKHWVAAWAPYTVEPMTAPSQMKVGTAAHKNWDSKKDRRDAAAAFLRKTITDPDVRSAVLTDRYAAHQLFEREGGINIPDDVEVICVGPSTQERDRLVVFVLPPESTSTEQIDPLRYWIASWPPYATDPLTRPLPNGHVESGTPMPGLQVRS